MTAYNSANIRALDHEFVEHTYKRNDVCLVSGKGSLLFDETGKRYIDLGTGIGVNAFGAADDVWAAAVKAQIDALPHASNLYYTAPQALLAEELCRRTGMKKVFFGNSGAEANECALKVARKYGAGHKGPDCFTIVTLKNSFHGRTIATLAATGQDAFHQDFGPFPAGFAYAAANDLEDMERMFKEHAVCAVLMEMVQGEGGVNCLKKEYVQGVAKLCGQNDALLMVDEVQTGNGRTGTLYAYEQFGILPDVVTTAKGLGGGLPIGACLMGEKAAGVLGFGQHGSTFGGNPIAAAGALSILSRIDDALLEGVKERGDYIAKELTGAKGVKSVSGLGLMVGVECERPVGEVLAECMEAGVLVLTAKTKVRLLPALNIPMDLLGEAICILKGVLAK